MKTLKTVLSMIEADTLCATLAANGIKATIPSEGIVGANPLLANAVGGIRVEVDDGDLLRAQDIVKCQSEAASPGMFECPKCGSDSVNHERVSRRFAYLSLLLLGLPLLWFRNQCTCRSCGNKWKES